MQRRYFMETTKQTHDIKIFSAMVEILTKSGLGDEDYGLKNPNRRYDQIRYEKLASVMNQIGFFNRAGQPLNKNTLKQTVHRVCQKKELMNRLKPDWDQFRDSEYTPDTPDITREQHKPDCLVCGVQKKGKKLCSSDCVKVYQEHKDAPHDTKFPTIFHQMRDQGSSDPHPLI
jgi:hypothetical protein